MPSSAVRIFTDPDEYATSVRAGTVKLIVAERGNFNAKLVRIDLHRLWMQRFSENLARIVDTTSHVGGRIYLFFRVRPGPRLTLAGIEMHPSFIVRYSSTTDYYQQSSGAAEFATMSLPLADLATIGDGVAGVDLTSVPGDPRLVTPPPAPMQRLQRLHAAAGHLAEHAPEIIANPHAARGLEQALVGAMFECLGGGQERESTIAQGQHAIVMRRFRRVLEENPEEALFIPEICKAIGVAGRTLRLCCQEHLGMSPKRYLLLRRMNLVRRALHRGTADLTNVTDVATRYGFWQLGRFAVEYRALFGESPSVTLQRQPD
jgi:AraC-like DNA-binding protein